MFGFCVVLASGAGCGGGKKGSPDAAGGTGGTGGSGEDAAVTQAALRVVSTPVNQAAVGQALQYRPVLSEPGAADWILDQGPEGASIDSVTGELTWTPTEDQGGEHRFRVRGNMAGRVVDQDFNVRAARPVVQASAEVDPGHPNGASVAVNAPLSPVRGSAVQIEPGALPDGPPISVTISSIENAPVPVAARIAGMNASDLRPVEFGPTGLTFNSPVKIHLPISEAVLARGTPEVQTFDYQTGRWERVPVVHVDAASRVAVAEVRHFSPYVVTPAAPLISLALGRGAAASACAGALIVKAPLAGSAAQIPAALINGYAGAGQTLADVVAGMQVGQALRVFTRVTASAAAGTGEVSGWTLASATRTAGGFRVSITTDTHATPFLSIPAELAVADPELLAWLGGSRVHLVFAAPGALEGGASATADVSLYLGAAADADRLPPEAVNLLGREQATASTLAAFDGLDDDCDEAPNAFDPEPQGPPPPVLTGTPASPVRVTVGATATLTVASSQTGTTFSWSGSDTSLRLTPAAAGTSATITPQLPGDFRVDVSAGAGAAATRFTWDVRAEPAVAQAKNTAPAATLGASTTRPRAGEPVELTCYGRDPEQPRLSYLWTAPSSLAVRIDGPRLVFTPPAQGDYPFGCKASDGLLESPPASIVVSASNANRAPGAPTVTPMAATLEHEPGAPVSVMLTASAIDRDGDTPTYQFVPDPATPPSFSLAVSGASAAFSTTQDGLYTFYVTAQDPGGLVSPWTVVRVQVIPKIPVASVDADRDGFPAGVDCNDDAAAIYPGAREICGDGIDQSCDGRDAPLTECDRDGDRVSQAQGDCDDANPAVAPGVPERCDGIDNDCDSVVDEGFQLGLACSVGVGACQRSGQLACNAARTGVSCAGAPGAPAPEVCDAVDNDCNGRVDDTTAAVSGDVLNCGGCGVKCVAAPNTVAACVSGGCVLTCAAGFVDLDRAPTNGCECAVTNGGVETCDGLDNDCNGSVDEGVGATYFTGPTETLGVGVCAAGTKLCVGGQLVISRAERLPSPEKCDGLDNDCDRQTDELWSFSSDPANCGACHVVCPAGAACVDGRCAAPPTGGTSGGNTGGTGGGGGADRPDGGLAGSTGATGGAGGIGGADAGAAGSGGTMPPIEVRLATCTTANGALCTDLMRDPANCGVCGATCASPQVCQNGACGTCAAPMTSCPVPDDSSRSFCTDTFKDPRNCGACGRVCAANTYCSAGACVDGMTAPPDSGVPLICPTDLPHQCSTAAGTTYCTDFNRDSANCGGCGFTCPAGAPCDFGRCGGTTAPPPDGGTDGGGGSTSCPATAPNGCTDPTGGVYCADVASDPMNCGACGRVCPAATTCQQGTCLSSTGGTTCPTDRPVACTTANGIVCSDLRFDPMNCGTCGMVCPDGQACSEGTCGGATTSPCPTSMPNVCRSSAGETTCTDFRYDPMNCGGCGYVCPANSTCQGGVCGGTSTTTCPSAAPNTCVRPDGTTYCTDLTSDAGNCGGCGRVCPAGVSCQGGLCGGSGTSTCPATAPNACADATGGTYCTDLRSDARNCGACWHACPDGVACQAGICTNVTATCAAPTTSCPAGDGTAYCADLANDVMNCGRCGFVCGPSASCQAGVCSGMTCPAPATPCSSAPVDANGDGVLEPGPKYCADLRTDAANCGGCGFTCPPGGACQDGRCIAEGTAGAVPGVMACPSSTGGPTCADVWHDTANCGACGRACATGQACIRGACASSTISCPTPLAACGPIERPYCADFASDPGNCGGCGHVCGAGMTCQGGVCVTGSPTCPSTMISCPLGTGTTCVDPSYDPGNCGGCGYVCPAAAPTCQAGRCAATSYDGGVGTCWAGALWCAKPDGGGLCTDPASDRFNCGWCGNVCAPDAFCQGGQCWGGGASVPDGGVSCVPPLVACLIGTATTCIDQKSDPMNCGGCGRVCPADTTCNSGVCGMYGGTGGTGGTTDPCGGAPMLSCLVNGTSMCVDTAFDSAHCGYCGGVCARGTRCVHSICTASETTDGGFAGPCAPPSLLCNGRCVDASMDLMNCGACTAICPSGYACTQGSCTYAGGGTGTGGSSGTADAGATTTCLPPARLCNNVCTDVMVDSANCGWCGNMCSPGAPCLQGTCGTTTSPGGG